MGRNLFFSDDVIAWLRGIDRSLARKICPAINSLRTRPFPDGHVRLPDGDYRIRVEGHRVLYDVTKDGGVVRIWDVSPVLPR